jgi:hypothetical protein
MNTCKSKRQMKVSLSNVWNNGSAKFTEKKIPWLGCKLTYKKLLILAIGNPRR